MKASFIVICLTCLFLFSEYSFPQGQGIIWFLTFPTSPSQNAIGYAGTSIPMDDPYSFLLNPAQLGYTSQKTNLSFMFYPSKADLWGFNIASVNGSALNLGYNFNDILGVPLSIGASFIHQKQDMFFRYSATEGENKNLEKYNIYSLGIGYDSFIQLSAGITYKNINSQIPDYLSSFYPPPFYEIKTDALDFGILLTIPIIKIIDESLVFDFARKISLKPSFKFSIGYSQLNIGDEISFFSPVQSAPLPRTARLGYGVSTGLEIPYDNPLQIIGLDFTVDANDILLNYETIYTGRLPDLTIHKFTGYQSFIGDINIGRNIIQIKGDDKVSVHAGFQAKLFESFIYKVGHNKGAYSGGIETNGYEIRTSGLLKFICELTDNNTLIMLRDHIDIRYYYSRYSLNENLETKINGIALYIQNIHTIF